MIPLIQLLDVRKVYTFGDSIVTALDSVSLDIHHGEFVAIVGQSGSGKSTLMNILGCLDSPTHGQYLLDGKNVGTLSDTALSKIRNAHMGFVFQGFNLIPIFTALENVELPLMYRGINRFERTQIATQALSQVGLRDRMHHHPAQLSGGQQQRVAIARAIAGKPSLILADEPTGNLDSSCGLEIMNLLHALNHAGHTVVLITHDQKIATSIPRTIQLHDGRLLKAHSA